MATEDKDQSPDRKQTDDSLRTERENADRALREKQSAVQHDADVVVQLARDTADAVLVAAREQADDRLEDTAPRSIIAEARIAEDRALRTERAAADESLQREREEIGALSRLLPLERQKTDRYLLTERARSDDDVAHRDDFLGIVSHDLRNLLSGIVMSATMLAERATPTDEGQRTTLGAERIQRYAARMNRLIGDLVDVASIDAGRLAVTPTRGDVAALIDEAVDMFHALAAERQISLEAQLAKRPELADFDHDRMIQVLANLITNAIKFTPAGGSIIVRTARADDRLEISVTDTGVGISTDKLDAVFERFWQAGKSDRRGVGLGLYISKCIVVAHGGTIRAQSEPGVGSTFVFTL